MFGLKNVDNLGMSFVSAEFTESRPLQLPQSGLGVHEELEGALSGQVTPADPRDIPFYMTPFSGYKAGGRTRKGGCLEWSLSSQVTVM